MSRSFPAFMVGWLAWTVVLAPVSHLPAAPPNRKLAPEGPTTVRLAIDPAAEPRPAFKYTFLTPLASRKAGNAAPFYYRAILAFTTYRAEVKDAKGKRNLDNRLDEWGNMPLERLPRDEMRRVINGFAGYEDLREAASRERCDWDYQLQNVEGLKNIEFRLMEVQDSRGVARFLAAKARLEIAEGRYADAVDTMRIGYQLARDVATTPILISSLVGCAIAEVLDQQAHVFFAARQSPNLYWAYTELPRPFIDMRSAIEFELTMPRRMFPMLKDPEQAQHSPEQWADIVSHAYFALSHVLDSGPIANTYGWESRLAVTGLALRSYTQAKRDLVAAGYDPAKIEQMPVGQVIAVDEEHLSRYIADEVRKWTLVSYPEAGKRAHDAFRKLVAEHYLGPGLTSREVLPINSVLLPATAAAMDASIRRDVSIAADRVIEAIRMHAAQNDGKLPQSLSEIAVVPVPVHPRFGTPFPYKLAGNTATLEVRRVTQPPEPMGQGDVFFEITVARHRR